ncbi:MAG: photosynthetic complex putative assembly protein PuhB [Pseudomonadota bacterium]
MSHDDFAVEPIPGLPERLPPGERILWQGRPSTWALAREALALWWVVGYFVLLAVWRVGASSADIPFVSALPQAIPFMALGLLAGGIILLIAWVQAKATVYTITNARVAMRIGAALTVTLNLPFNRIFAADLDRRGDTGTIAFRTEHGARLSYLVLWPHVRPWKMRPTQPALRCVPEIEKVSQVLAEAAETRLSEPRIRSVQSGDHDAVAAE